MTSVYSNKKNQKRAQISARTLLLTSGFALLPGSVLAQQAATGVNPPPPSVVKENQFQDVVITARHRTERSQSVPISLTTVNSRQLKSLGSQNIAQIKQLIPSLTINSYNPRQVGIDIRGLGSVGFLAYDGLEDGVDVYLDGVLQGRTVQSSYDFSDIQDIEVLRGPQGTLFGKNTVAGAVVINTKLPSFKPEADISASYGNYNYWQLQGYATSALGGSDKAAASLSVHVTQRNGFATNEANGQTFQNQDDKGVRAQFLLEPNSNLTVRIIANYDHQDANCCQVFPAGLATPVSGALNVVTQYAGVGYTLPKLDAFDRKADLDSWTHYAMETASLSAQADYNLDGFTLTSITAGSYYNWYPHTDGDGLGVPVLPAYNSTTHQRQFSQELRVTSPLGGRVDYTGGLYFFYQQLNDQTVQTFGSDAAAVLLPGGKSNPGYGLTNLALSNFSNAATDIPETYSGAAYGQATWHITPKLDVTGGARFTYEDVTGRFNQVQEGGVPVASLPGGERPVVQAIRNGVSVVESYQLQHSDMLPGGLVTLSYKPEPNVLTYATYSHGEKSAGLNFLTSSALPRVVAPEKLDNYEIGAKTTLFNQRLLLNGDGFWDEDTDFQSLFIATINLRPTQYLASVPKVRSRGFEFDAHALVNDNLTVFASGIFDEAVNQSNPAGQCPYELSNVSTTCNLNGRPIAGASKWAASFGGEYDQPLPEYRGQDVVAYFAGNVLLKTGFYSTGDDSKYSYVPGYGIGNINFGIREADGRWDLSGWVHNITDQKYYLYRAVNGSFPIYNLIYAAVGDPLTFGFTLRAKFQ